MADNRLLGPHSTPGRVSTITQASYSIAQFEALATASLGSCNFAVLVRPIKLQPPELSPFASHPALCKYFSVVLAHLPVS